MTTLNGRITVAIADLEPIAIEGLRALLTRGGVYDLLPGAKTLDSLAHAIMRMGPRVALVDKNFGSMEVMNWVQRNAALNTALVVWGPSFTDPEALRLMQAGARGVLRKTARLESIIACLDAVCGGATWMDDNLLGMAGARHAMGRTDLTVREQQVLELVEQGLRNKDIARELGIQPGTVKIHLKHIFEKSGVRGRYGLALSGLRQRFVEPQALSA